MEGFLTTQQAAQALRLSEVTLKRWRAKGQGPLWCAIGGRIFYQLADLRHWRDEFLTMPHDIRQTLE
ncbi:helix-turn-helix domain-containing protein [Antarcticirhabdus aurantiaca]|uniref:helix-turn-helix domain-containing protein n=1 Tax=Antarcticirhabdus aurantiaca TaxID=2606717 RepID=UPI0034E2FF0F